MNFMMVMPSFLRHLLTRKLVLKISYNDLNVYIIIKQHNNNEYFILFSETHTILLYYLFYLKSIDS